jgi:hypothetical protein
MPLSARRFGDVRAIFLKKTTNQANDICGKMNIIYIVDISRKR